MRNTICKFGVKDCEQIGCDCFKNRLKESPPGTAEKVLTELTKFATNHPDTYVRFQEADIDADVLRIVIQALNEGLIGPIQLFLIGMDQGAQKDWEDYPFLVHHIENILPNEWPEKRFPMTRNAIQKFWEADYEAKEDRACEVDVP
jgi:hypothetical protein